VPTYYRGLFSWSLGGGGGLDALEIAPLQGLTEHRHRAVVLDGGRALFDQAQVLFHRERREVSKVDPAVALPTGARSGFGLP
jgi:hypothetical protein